MNDEVKDALAEVRVCAANGSDPTTWALLRLLTHIDAEPARIVSVVRAVEAENATLRDERDTLRRRIFDACPSPDEHGHIHAGGRIVCGQCHDSDVQHLTNERDALRAALGMVLRGGVLTAAGRDRLLTKAEGSR